MNTLINLLPVITVFVLVLARILEVKTKRDTVKGPVQECTTFRLFVIVVLVMLIGSLVEYYVDGGNFQLIPYVVGLGIGVASFVIRKKAINALGKFWSLHVEIRDNHELMTSGPFRYVRHPTYFSMILELLAIGVICHAWIMCIAIFALYLPVLHRRVQLEEKALIEKFGDQYRDYIKSTPAILPLKWK